MPTVLLAMVMATVPAAGGRGRSDFTLDASPVDRQICAPVSAVYSISVGSLGGFSEVVTLSADGVPAGTSTSFSLNPVSPPGTSDFTISNTASTTPGQYALEIVGTSSPSSFVHMTTITLEIYASAPGAASPQTPANGATNVSQGPRLAWTPGSSAQAYDLQVALDDAFTNVVYTATTQLVSHVVSVLAPATQYWWRVRSFNPCGSPGFSSSRSFTTGEDLVFADGFESGNTNTWSSKQP